MTPSLSEIGGFPRALDAGSSGAEMHALMTRLFPICRSITGDGFRQTLEVLRRYVPIEVHEVPTGTQVLDWTIPKEWNIREAHVTNRAGERVIDLKASNLHVASYSVPVKTRLSLDELRNHVYTLPGQPDLIPYRTTYYSERWAFCMSDQTLTSLGDGDYDVYIDSTLQDGSLTYGECVLPGATDREILVSAHACHPSLANDNLSGVVLAVFLARYLQGLSLRYTYRFVFIPGTIGSITWLARNEERVDRIAHGLVAACVGDGGAFTYKRSRRGDAHVDRAAAIALRDSGRPHRLVDFAPFGYDERQYCSPGFDLPVGCLSRTPHGQFPQYHTSADDLTFVRPAHLAESLEIYLSVLGVLERDGRYRNRSPKGEPQLGKRGLYPSVGGTDAGVEQMAMLWTLNLSDGHHSLVDVAGRSGLAFDAIRRAADALAAHDLLEPLPEATDGDRYGG